MSKAEAEAAKKAEAAAKKAEREALLAAEEASLPTKKKAPSAKDKKAAASAFKTNAGIAAFRTDDSAGLRRDPDRKIDELSAVGIEGMLEAMEIVNTKTDNQALGAKVSNAVRSAAARGVWQEGVGWLGRGGVAWACSSGCGGQRGGR